MMMLILWSTIFVVLVPSRFIVVHSRALPMNYEESQQWTSSVVDSANGDIGQEELLGLSFKAGATLLVEDRKVPVCSDHHDVTIKEHHRRDIGVSSEENGHQKKRHTLVSLLKGPGVQVADKDFVIGRRSKKTKVDVRRKALPNNNNSAGNITVTPSNTSFQISPNDTSNRASNNRSQQRFIRCQVTRDIYITDVNENLPSYACKLGNNTLFFSSKRFSRGRINSLDVSVDDDTLRRLNNNSSAPTGNISHIIEVILALKFDSENYEVHHRRAEL